MTKRRDTGKGLEKLDKHGEVFTITCCGKCPLYIQDDRGDYCAHPHAILYTPANPFARQREDGLWVAPGQINEDELPGRCPLRASALVLRVPG